MEIEALFNVSSELRDIARQLCENLNEFDLAFRIVHYRLAFD